MDAFLAALIAERDLLRSRVAEATRRTELKAAELHEKRSKVERLLAEAQELEAQIAVLERTGDPGDLADVTAKLATINGLVDQYGGAPSVANEVQVFDLDAVSVTPLDINAASLNDAAIRVLLDAPNRNQTVGELVEKISKLRPDLVRDDRAARKHVEKLLRNRARAGDVEITNTTRGEAFAPAKTRTRALRATLEALP